MAILTLISGESGSGKSHSLKNLDWDKTFIIRPNRKPFPFKSSHIKPWDPVKKTGNFIYTTDYGMISAILKKLPGYGKEIIVIEDSTHILLEDTMAHCQEKGFDKYTNAALSFYEMIKAATYLPDNVRVYMITHLNEDQNGNSMVKVTGGKMITEKIAVESMATIALGAVRVKEKYSFITQTSGRDFYKSPEGLFDGELIDNDLAMVDKKIVEFFPTDEVAQ